MGPGVRPQMLPPGAPQVRSMHPCRSACRARGRGSAGTQTPLCSSKLPLSSSFCSLPPCLPSRAQWRQKSIWELIAASSGEPTPPGLCPSSTAFSPKCWDLPSLAGSDFLTKKGCVCKEAHGPLTGDPGQPGSQAPRWSVHALGGEALGGISQEHGELCASGLARAHVRI